jgi:intein/homing endonuclease
MEAIKYFTKNTDYEVLTIDGFKNFEGISLQNNTTYNVEFTNDISIKCTLNHKFFSIDRNKWIEVKNFKKGELTNRKPLIYIMHS